jgi:lysophospholipase L1-like esterase
MKRFFILASLIAALASARAQSTNQAEATSQTNAPAKTEKATDWAAFFRMHYDTRVRAFKEQNLGLRNVVLLGDSITEGFDVAKYFPGRRVINRGIGADVIGNALETNDNRGVLKRLDNSVFDCAATDVFLLIGINDLGAHHTVDVIEEGYRELLKQIHEKAPALRVHVESVLPTRDNYAKHNAPVRDLNERLRKMAAEFGYDFIDLHKLMADEKGELKAGFTRDGLHITEPAYLLWRAEVLKAMKWD